MGFPLEYCLAVAISEADDLNVHLVKNKNTAIKHRDVSKKMRVPCQVVDIHRFFNDHYYRHNPLSNSHSKEQLSSSLQLLSGPRST